MTSLGGRWRLKRPALPVSSSREPSGLEPRWPRPKQPATSSPRLEGPTMTTRANADLAGFVGTWKLNTERTSMHFRTRAAWIIPAKGTLQATHGTAHVGADGRLSGEIVI